METGGRDAKLLHSGSQRVLRSIHGEQGSPHAVLSWRCARTEFSKYQIPNTKKILRPDKTFRKTLRDEHKPLFNALYHLPFLCAATGTLKMAIS